MNVILTYTQIKEFTEIVQGTINQIQFSQIPEMKVIDTLVNDKEGNFSYNLHTIPYQANVKDERELNILQLTLENFGTVDIIGKWNDDGSKIELDINKYRDALNDVEVFEKAQDLEMVTDEDGVESEVVVKEYTRVKSSKIPTLAQAKSIQVNVFNNKFKREL